MGQFLSNADLFVGRLNAIINSVLYRGISRESLIIGAAIYDKRKLVLEKKSVLIGCRLRICSDSKFIKIGAASRIENNAFLNAHTGSITIGKKCFVGPNCVIQGYGNVRIGDGVMIAGNTFISSSNHLFQNVSKRDFLLKEEGKETVINDYCWIGSNVTIVAGVEIGERCVIGAGSVVTKNIPPYSVAVGSPAKVIKKITLIPEDV